LKKIWAYGTSTPIQRFGVIILIIGLLSLLSWIYKTDMAFEDIFDPYYMPRSRDFIFFHFYLYFIPIGLLLSWGYSFLIKTKRWIVNGNNTNRSTENNKVNNLFKNFNKPKLKNLHFKDNLAAFKYASENYKAVMTPNKMSLGIIQDEFQLKDGSNCFLVQLADIGKTTLVSGFNDNFSGQLSKGNLIYWGFVEQIEDKNFPHISAIGHVLATLSPELDPNNGKWVIKKDLTK
jgi:hypothetical protein